MVHVKRLLLLFNKSRNSFNQPCLSLRHAQRDHISPKVAVYLHMKADNMFLTQSSQAVNIATEMAKRFMTPKVARSKILRMSVILLAQVTKTSAQDL